jgi:hypothetical protein
MAENGLQVVVRFPETISHEVQGPALLWLELTLRTLTKLDIRVVKDLQGDDSKLRKLMTIHQREKL